MRVFTDEPALACIRLLRKPEACSEWDRSVEMDIVVAKRDGSPMPVCPALVGRLRSKGWTGLEQIPPACFGRI